MQSGKREMKNIGRGNNVTPRMAGGYQRVIRSVGARFQRFSVRTLWSLGSAGGGFDRETCHRTDDADDRQQPETIDE
jgi:hypothetical protein